jgi:hypothetical protein
MWRTGSPVAARTRFGNAASPLRKRNEAHLVGTYTVTIMNKTGAVGSAAIMMLS